MTDSTYTGKYGSLRAMSTSLLNEDFYRQASGKSPEEILKMLSETRYRKQLDELSQLYQMPDLFEAVINATMAKSLQEAYVAMPPLAQPFVKAYISKWDIENIKVVLSSKAMGYELTDTSHFMLAVKNPVGILAGSISKPDYTNMLAQKDVVSVVNYLAKFGYGAVLMSHIDDYAKNGSLAPMLTELGFYYYTHLAESLRFYKGDEGPVYEYIIAMIDAENVLNAAKASYSGMQEIQQYAIKGGSISSQQIAEAVNGKAPDAVSKLLGDSAQDSLSKYISAGKLSELEAVLKRSLYKRFMPTFSASSQSLSYIMSYILRLESERDALRALLLQGYYGIKADFAFYAHNEAVKQNGS
ncbi:V-type ATPase subunit [Candidatus Marsarchaeota archaeon]|nr:V-type ATPase subunit [Candidatus Marsarchaeota archaeon]